jgi:glycosyltransferase involved in cell wall biosynthesis
MKKVLVLHASTMIGGAEYSLLEFLRHLDSTRVSVHMACSAGQALFRHVHLLPVRVHDICLPYLTKKHPVKTWMEIIKVSFRLYRLVRKENIRAVYCNTFRSLPFCLFIKWRSRLKIVCHCRDHITSRAVRFMIRILADECIAVSGSICRELPRSSKKHIIHNGVNPLLFQREDTSKALTNRYGLPEHTQLVGNIGQITPWKNQTDYLSVAASLLSVRKDIHFFMVGAVVDKAYFLLIQKQIRMLGLEPHVTLTGHVENIAGYLSGFTVVLHTARNEPFGRVMIEAAASCKPVVAYASGGSSEIIEDGKTGFLIADGDIETMAELTAKLLDDPGLRTGMGQSAGEHAARHFNGMDYARKVYQVLAHDS